MAETDEGQEQGNEPTPRMEWVRLALDFIARAFYPAIILLVLFMLRPSLSEIDVPGLVNRLQSASVGSTQLTFNQAEDVAITIAPLNSRVADMQRTITDLQAELETLRGASGVPKISVTPTAEQAEKARRIQQNAAYTVLVFHSAGARERAVDVTAWLLDAGYAASSAETDFSELPRKMSPGSIYMTHTEKADEVYRWIGEGLEKRFPGTPITVLDEPSVLRRGDVQILLF